MLERALTALNSSLSDVEPDSLSEIVETGKFQNEEDLLHEIGLGNQMASVVARRLVQSQSADTPLELDYEGPLAIRGTEGMVVTYARCCRPIPGDPIIGHISAGKGIVIHIDSCRNMGELRTKGEEVMAVRWEDQIDQEFTVEMRIELEHEKGLIAMLASTITGVDANIERISILERDARLTTVNLLLQVRDRVHLAAVIKKLRHIHHVNRIVRVRN